MNRLWLKFILESEACFSRGDGTPGMVDIEVNHDRYGFPFLGGRTLKGLLHAQATEILDTLRRAAVKDYEKWAKSANRLFGQPGSRQEKEGKLHLGDAQLPADLRQQVAATFKTSGWHRYDILETLTTIRRQTAIDRESGAPQEETLRSTRAILRGLPFTAPLIFKKKSLAEERQDELAFLAACVKAFRRAGSNKTRGYGKLKADLYTSLDASPITDAYFLRFKEAIQV